MIKKIPLKGRGFVMVFVLLLVLLLVLIVMSFSTAAINDIILAERLSDNIRAYYTADAGLADGMIQLRAQTTLPTSLRIPTTGTTNLAFPGNTTGAYSVQINTVSAASTWFKTYDVISTATYPSGGKTTRILTLTVSVASTALWGYVSNTEHHPVWGDLYFGTGMVVEGPVQTNGQFNIYGTPTFTGDIASVATTIHYYPWTTNAPVFQGKVSLGVPAIDLFTPITDPTPSNDMITSLTTLSQATGGLYLKFLAGGGQASIKINSDSTLTILAPGEQTAGYENPTTIPMPTNGIVYVDGGDTRVQGTLNGALTIGSSHDIWIDKDLLYHDKTGSTYSGSDVLALVANNNITVSATASGAHAFGTQGLELDGYLVAVNGSFQVDQFDNYVIKGDLVQFGGFCNKIDGPTGMFNSSGTMVSGYNQLCRYDVRFGDTTAPLIPNGFVPVRDSSSRIAYKKIGFAER